MRCPMCKRETTWEGNPHRPFCSERCKLIDLDNWLSERYRISSPFTDTDDGFKSLPDERDDKDSRD
jgi:uncharacterized protein